MSLFSYVLPKLLKINSLHSNISFELRKFNRRDIDEPGLIQNTLEMRASLLGESAELHSTLKILGPRTPSEIRDILGLARRIESQALRVSHALELPLDDNEALLGLAEIYSNVSLLGNTFCSKYDEMATNRERDRTLVQCYEKMYQSLERNPFPFFEIDISEYNEVIDNVSIEYSQNTHSTINKKMVKFPGIISVLSGFLEVTKRHRFLRLIREYNEGDVDSIPPFSNEILSLIPCIDTLNIGFDSIDDFKTSYIDFFLNGKWLEIYVYLMLERLGISTRLLNVNLSFEDILLEVDVLVLYRAGLYMLETKDRGNAEGLTENDRRIIENQCEKISRIGDLNLVYIINSKEEYQGSISEIIEEIASSKGISVDIIYLENDGIDNINTKLRSKLR